MKTCMSVVIVDDNQSLSYLIRDGLNKEEAFEVIGLAHDGEVGIQMITDLKPDIVILDMVMPKADGLTVLETFNGKKGPNFVVLSAIGHDVITKKSMSLGAMYYIVKPFEVTALINRMKQLFLGDPIKEIKKEEVLYNIHLTELISKELNVLAVPLHVKGYHYIKDSVQLVVESNDQVLRITKDIYPVIAQKSDTTATSVERAIRHAIDITLTRGPMDIISEYFKNELFNNKITNKEFIVGIADTVKHRL